MARFATILLGLTFVMSVVTMVLVLLLFVTQPWDDAITEAELSEILQAAQETSKEDKEAERKAKCESVHELMKYDNVAGTAMGSQMEAIILENNCILDWHSP